MPVSKNQDRSAPIGHTIPAVILAAGKGTRMKTHEPKAAVPIGGRPMVARVADAMRGAGLSRIIAVVGHRADDVRVAIGDDAEYVVQEEQLGTGHAARCAHTALQSYEGPILIAYADIPLLPKNEVARLIARHIETGAAATLLTAIFDEPGTLGRIIRAPDDRVEAIVEARDATKQQLAIREINVGVYCFQAPLVFETFAELTSENAQRQFYLTDAIGILVRRGERVEALVMEFAHSGMGGDTEEDLARAQHYWTMGEAL
jgi:bifunctional UDP-N-acetylglucosamine pyrophosphorylase/glucosamine-1-phosphate N-acetyltransferase